MKLISPLFLTSILLSISNLLSAQNLFCISEGKGIEILGKISSGELDLSRYENIPQLEEKDIIQTSIPGSQGAHYVYVLLELPSDMVEDWKKFYFKKPSKFDEKYTNLKFALDCHLNGNKISIYPYDSTEFNSYPYVALNGTKTTSSPSGILLVRSINNIPMLQVMVSLNSLATKDEFKSFLKNGVNTFKFSAYKNLSKIAETSITYEVNLMDPIGVYCDMRENKLNNEEYTNLCVELFKKKNTKDVLDIIAFLNENIMIRTNNAGIPTVKFNTALVYYKSTNGKTYEKKIHFKEPYVGGGNYGKLEMEVEGTEREIDSKCINAYKEKFAN